MTAAQAADLLSTERDFASVAERLATLSAALDRTGLRAARRAAIRIRRLSATLESIAFDLHDEYVLALGVAGASEPAPEGFP